MSKKDTLRVRVTIRRSILERAELAAEVLGAPSATWIMTIAMGLGLRFLEMTAVKPVALRKDLEAALGPIVEAGVEQEVGDA